MSEHEEEVKLLGKKIKLNTRTWKVEQELGSGSYGTVYMVTRGGNHVAALKVAHNNNDASIPWEGTVLRELHKVERKVGVVGLVDEGSASVVDKEAAAALVQTGSHHTFYCVAMEHLHPVAPTVAELLRHYPAKRLDVGKGTRVAMQMLRGLYELHSLGLIHRDLKPENVGVLPIPNDHSVALVDVGMARAYAGKDGRPREPRSFPGEKGTPSFESWRVLTGRDASRADDLFSWFYTVIEILRGELTLPWDITNVVADDEHLEDHLLLKSRLISSDLLLKGLPEEYYAIRIHLSTLAYEDVPDYSFLFRSLANVLARCPGAYPTDSLLPPRRNPNE